MAGQAGCAVPVAFFVFNRPEPTRRVFAAIRAARPAILLVVADGARPDRPGEAERVAEVRAIATAVDWPCDVRTNFSAVNLGCKRRVSSGIDWVFGEVERAIILEDDCLPSPAFFGFCEAMLHRYAADRRIYSISGSNFAEDAQPQGHYYSNFALMWGWATWRDRWADYEFEPAYPAEVIRRMWGGRPLATMYWRHLFRELVADRLNAWDYQWMLTLWKRGALTVRPTVNLVRNIGFGADATNTFDDSSRTATLAAWDGDPALLEAEHPGPVVADRARDAIDERYWAQINWRTIVLIHWPWTGRLKRKLMRLVSGNSRS